MGQAVETAVAKYPATRASLEQVSAAAAGINLARTSFLPRVDLLGQINRATDNNVAGLLLPQPLAVLPSISGPVRGSNGLTSAWGTAVGVMVSWEPLDFGLRKANVAVAESTRQRAERTVARTKFEVETAAADAYLTLLAAMQTVKAAQAGVERASVLEKLTGAVVQAELRPGADLSRARAESAMARNLLIQAEQSVDISRAALAQLLGVSPSQVAVQAGPLLELPPGAQPERGNASDHPFAREQSAAVDEIKAREKSLDRTYFPKLAVQGSSYTRGTGVERDGAFLGGANGLAPNFQNWALGLSVTFSLMDLPALRAKKEIELHRERSETARYDQLLQDLDGRREKAQAVLNGARRLAENTPVQLEASQTAEQQAAARYKAGLGTLVEVAEAQRLLTQSEIDNSLAKLNVWRAMLAVAAAQGSLQPILKAGSGQ